MDDEICLISFQPCKVGKVFIRMYHSEFYTRMQLQVIEKKTERERERERALSESVWFFYEMPIDRFKSFVRPNLWNVCDAVLLFITYLYP